MSSKKTVSHTFEDFPSDQFDSMTFFHTILRFEGKIEELKSKFLRHQISSHSYYEEYERLGLKLRNIQRQIREFFPNLAEI